MIVSWIHWFEASLVGAVFIDIGGPRRVGKVSGSAGFCIMNVVEKGKLYYLKWKK